MRSIRALLGAGALAAGALCVSAPAAHADIIIDDWSVNQGPLRQPGESDVRSTVSGSMFGGRRELRGSNGDSKSGGGYTTEVSDGKLRAMFEPGRFASVQASWRSSDGGFDLTQGGQNDRFRFASILAPNFTIGGNDSTFSYQILYVGEAVNGSDVDVMFSSFEYYNYFTGEFRAATAADFQSIGSLSLSSRTQNGEFPDGTTMEIGTFSTVPTPSAAALLALGGLAAVRRRR